MAENQAVKKEIEIKTIIDLVIKEAEVEIRRLQRIERALISRQAAAAKELTNREKARPKEHGFAGALQRSWLQGQLVAIRTALAAGDKEGGAS